MSVHAKDFQVVGISGAFHYSVSNNHIVVLGRETPEIIITSFHPNECTRRYTEVGEKGAGSYGSVCHDLLLL